MGSSVVYIGITHKNHENKAKIEGSYVLSSNGNIYIDG